MEWFVRWHDRNWGDNALTVLTAIPAALCDGLLTWIDSMEDEHP